MESEPHVTTVVVRVHKSIYQKKMIYPISLFGIYYNHCRTTHRAIFLGPLLIKKKQTSMGFKAWISCHITFTHWDVITNP